MAGNPSASRSAHRWAALFPCCFLGMLLLFSCGQVPTADPGRTDVAGSAPALHTRPEAVSHTPCGPLWSEGEEATLRGLYRTSGEQAYIDVVRVQSGAPPCWARFFLDRDIGLGAVSWDAPYYLEVTGRPSSARWSSPGLWDLQVARWSELPFDTGTAREACRQAVAAQSAALQQLDWAALASPAYVTGTAGFRPAGADLAQAEVDIIGADDREPLLVMEAVGPDLPQVRPLVRRWVSVECVYDLEQARVTALVATIAGEVQE